jgi:hypothetical protein
MCNCGEGCMGANCPCPCHKVTWANQTTKCEAKEPPMDLDAQNRRLKSENEARRTENDKLRKQAEHWRRAYLALVRALNTEAGDSLL